MKKLLLIATLSICSIVYSQTQTFYYTKKLKDLKTYVNNVYKSDSTIIKSYVKNSQNGKIYPLKTTDVYDEYGDMIYENIYQILEKDKKIVYIKQLLYYWAEGIPFNESSYEYYFDENKNLIGVKKSTFNSYGDFKDISYNIEYVLNNKLGKLEKTSNYYAKGDKIVDSKSKDVKIADKDGMIKNSIKFLNNITIRDLEGFMKKEKIKYYK
ncbi:hypothetical protein [Chryseobacterium gambrini]|uniref:Uncharacterized protein n=1 Tax=Chryseobacterium gambrini TaxID=373672 RepID=A0A1N7NZ11_9FLAO|nr:hypothetical protein [Chryseobacterium gambrini]SIT03587.1 hypothetical protein SAMN05421785_105234 [Chryseobacterium gambrini]